VVTSLIQTAPAASGELLDQMLPLPDEQTLLAFEPSIQESCAVRTLDGLLAALLTPPGGKRAASVCHLLHAQRFDPQALQRGLSKVTRCIQRWKTYVKLQQTGGQVGWQICCEITSASRREHRYRHRGNQRRICMCS
jgi:hypothetical protein